MAPTIQHEEHADVLLGDVGSGARFELEALALALGDADVITLPDGVPHPLRSSWLVQQNDAHHVATHASSPCCPRRCLCTSRRRSNTTRESCIPTPATGIGPSSRGWRRGREMGGQYLIAIGGCVGIDGMVNAVVGNWNGDVVMQSVMGIHRHVHHMPHCQMVSTIRDLRNAIVRRGKVKGVFGGTPLLNIVQMVAIDQDGVTPKQLVQVIRF